MTDSQIKNRQRIIAALAVLDRGEEAADLIDFMSEEDVAVCESLIGEYSSKSDRELFLNRIVRQIVSSERFSSLTEVHPAWILERLRNESPRVIGLILRFLPSQHVRYLLKNLPPMLCEQIPNMVESFSVDPAVLDIIRQKFESFFLPMRVSRSIERFGFENLYYLRQSELEELLKELGIMEMAIALSGMSSKALRIIYNRLDIKDAKRLKACIDGLSGISPAIYRQSQNTLLMIENERVGPKRFLKTIGLAAFANAIGEGHEDLIRMIMQKLDPAEGYLLKRFVDEKRLRPCSVSEEERKDIILSIVGSLAREGRIDEAWSGFSHPDKSEFSGDHSRHVTTHEEETGTARQLA